MTDEPKEQPMPVFPQYAPPGVTVADPKQAKPLLKAINRLMRVKIKPRVSPTRKRVDSRRRGKDKFY